MKVTNNYEIPATDNKEAGNRFLSLLPAGVHGDNMNG